MAKILEEYLSLLGSYSTKNTPSPKSNAPMLGLMYSDRMRWDLFISHNSSSF